MKASKIKASLFGIALNNANKAKVRERTSVIADGRKFVMSWKNEIAPRWMGLLDGFGVSREFSDWISHEVLVRQPNANRMVGGASLCDVPNDRRHRHQPNPMSTSITRILLL